MLYVALAVCIIGSGSNLLGASMTPQEAHALHRLLKQRDL